MNSVLSFRGNTFTMFTLLLLAALFWLPVSSAFAGDIELFGNVGYSIDGDTVFLAADQVRNNRSNGQSGTLSLELWGKTSPSATTFYRMASARLGELPGQHFFYDIFLTTTIHLPPPGTYAVSMNLVEYPNTNSAVDSVTFSDALVVEPDSGGGALSPIGLAITSFLALSIIYRRRQKH